MTTLLRSKLHWLLGSWLLAALTVSPLSRADASLLVACTGLNDGASCADVDTNPCTLNETCRAGVCVPPATFGLGLQVSVDTGPRSVVVGDWTGDGILDLAVANRTANNVSIHKGDDSGVFVLVGSPVPVGNGPIAIAVGDWNGNGVRDLAVANSGSNTVSILLGDGYGGFSAAGTAVPVGHVPVSVATGDWNGDGKADLAVADQNDNKLTVLLGDGSGGFAAAPGSPVAVGVFPVSVVAGDWNGDGTPDLAVANQNGNNVTILLGAGNGEFGEAPSSPIAVAGGPFSIAAFASRASGILDLAVVSITGNTVTVLLGNGTGGFAAQSPIAVGTGPRSVATSDLNRDGRLDLAVANFGADNVTILLGNGSGGFAAVGTLAVGPGPSSIAGGDLDRDGKQDLVTANTTVNNLTVLLNNTTHATDNNDCDDHNECTAIDKCHSGVCAGTPVAAGSDCDDGNPCTPNDKCVSGVCAPPLTAFVQPAGSPITVGSGPRPVVIGDWNGDSILDLAVAKLTASTVSILLGDAAGGFTNAVGSPFVSAGGPISIAVGDWNGDGKSDLALANAATGSNSVTILLGNGAGGFSPAPGSPVTVGTVPVSVASGDLDGDGKLDLAVANQNSNNVTILRGNGGGGFTQLGSSIGVGTTPVSVVVGDWNGDARLDLAVANQGDDNVTIRLGNGDGTFGTGTTVSTGDGPFSIAAGDLNGDGRLDLAVANITSNDVTILLSSGAGTFNAAPGSPIAVGTGPRSVIMRDINRDGRLDLAMANFGTSNVTVLLGNGAGRFAPSAASPVGIAPGTGPSSVAGGDLNGDGKQDLVVANTSTNNVTILLNNTPVAGNGTACNDHNPCTQSDTCQSGVCTAGNPVSCTPSDTCHAGHCSVTTGACSNPRLPNGNVCSDGSACTSGESCSAGVCQGGSPIACNDGNACNGLETCSPATGCVAGTPVNCDDTQFCTIDTCNPSNGACSHLPNPCADDNACTLDRCLENSDVCAHDDVSVQYCNTGPITIPVLGAATPYPSAITVAGQAPGGSICSVSLNGISHTFPDDLDILLARSSGPNALIMSDVGGADDITNVNLVLSDAAATPMPNSLALVSGTYQPTNFESDPSLPAPAPAISGLSALSTFDGTDANGVWNLWVADDLNGDSGSIAGGWCMNVLSRACSNGSITINDSHTATPYPSTINISGASGVFTLVSVELHGIAHTYPDDIDILLAAPNVANGAIIMSDVGGDAGVSDPGVDITLADGAPLLPDSGPLFSGTFSPSNVTAGGPDGPDSWPAPAPTPSGSSPLSQFNGFNPNGAWRLFVVDDFPSADQGSISGWCITYRMSCNSTADCDDGNPCNGVEACNPATGCVAGTPLTCDDGNACNGVETCNPASGCQAGTALACDDGNACNGVETCSPASGCQAGTALACDDGNACNGVETCNPTSGCQAGTPVPPPSEPFGVSFGPAKSALSWSAAANATSYDVLRGALSGLPAGPGGVDELCIGNFSGTTASDATVPAAGTGAWYLIRGRNVCNPAGDYGHQGMHGTPGPTRVSASCS